MDGEIFFNMLKEPHPIYGKSEFLIKRWRKYTIYAKSGSYVRSDNPSQISILSSSTRRMNSSPTSNYTVPDSPKANVYSTNSIYLYDYVVVSDTWMSSSVYSGFTVDSTPALDSKFMGANQWIHDPNTWKDSPNAKTNDYILKYNPIASEWAGYPIYGYSIKSSYNLPPATPEYDADMNFPIFRNTDGTYFEIIRGYPRNHYTHKRGYFALERFSSYGQIGRQVTSASYQKGRQVNSTTIGPDGISDGSDPIQTTQVTNIDIIKSDNVIYH